MLLTSQRILATPRDEISGGLHPKSHLLSVLVQINVLSHFFFRLFGIFLNTYFIYIICIHVWGCAGSSRGQRCKSPLKLESQVILSCPCGYWESNSDLLQEQYTVLILNHLSSPSLVGHESLAPFSFGLFIAAHRETVAGHTHACPFSSTDLALLHSHCSGQLCMLHCVLPRVLSSQPCSTPPPFYSWNLS